MAQKAKNRQSSARDFTSSVLKCLRPLKSLTLDISVRPVFKTEISVAQKTKPPPKKFAFFRRFTCPLQQNLTGKNEELAFEDAFILSWIYYMECHEVQKVNALPFD